MGEGEEREGDGGGICKEGRGRREWNEGGFVRKGGWAKCFV